MRPSDKHHQILVISGPVHGGKTTFVSMLADMLKDHGIEPCGFICKGRFTGGERSAFTLVDLEDGSEIAFATTRKRPGWERFRRFYINPEALAKGERIARKAVREGSDLLVVDEVGPLELEGGGWSGILEMLAVERNLMQIWVARQQIVDALRQRWRIPGENIFRLEKGREEELTDAIMRRLVPSEKQTGK